MNAALPAVAVAALVVPFLAGCSGPAGTDCGIAWLPPTRDDQPFEFVRNVTGLADGVATAGVLDLQLSRTSNVSLRLEETSPFAPGQNYVETIHADGTRTRNEYDGRFFNGEVAGHPGARASVQISSWGIYANVGCGGRSVDVQPIVESGDTPHPEDATMRVNWY